MKNFLLIGIGIILGYFFYPTLHSFRIVRTSNDDATRQAAPALKTETSAQTAEEHNIDPRSASAMLAAKRAAASRVQITIKKTEPKSDSMEEHMVLEAEQPEVTGENEIVQDDPADRTFTVTESKVALLEDNIDHLRADGYVNRVPNGWRLHLSDTSDNVLAAAGFQDNDLIRDDAVWMHSGTAADENVKARFLAVLQHLEKKR